MGFISIRTSILTKLQALTTVSSANVIAAGTGVPAGFPYVTLEFIGEAETDNDEINKWQIFKWRIRVFANMDNTGSGPVWAETTILTVLDEIKEAFNDDYTLSNTVDNIEWKNISGLYTEFEAGEARIAELELHVYKNKQVVT